MQQPMHIQGRLVLAAEHADRLRGDVRHARPGAARRRVGALLVAAGLRLTAADAPARTPARPVGD